MQLATRPWITGGVALVSFETALSRKPRGEDRSSTAPKVTAQ
jgi:hypothetical protein